MKLNDIEKKLVAKYPVDAANVAYLAIKSGYLTKEHFSDEELINNKADAFRHYIWAGMVTKELGQERGMQFLNAHENTEDNPIDEKEMDLYNNSQGMKFSESYHGDNFENDLEKSGLEKIRSKGLKWLK